MIVDKLGMREHNLLNGISFCIFNAEMFNPDVPRILLLFLNDEMVNELLKLILLFLLLKWLLHFIVEMDIARYF